MYEKLNARFLVKWFWDFGTEAKREKVIFNQIECLKLIDLLNRAELHNNQQGV